MNLSFWKMCPSGNTTILISEPFVEPHVRAPIANILMHPLHLQAEQVAYVDMDARPPRINMMGGEFCGNACRSLAAMLAMHAGLQELEGTMLSSGTPSPVAYKVCTGDNGMMNASIRMPNTTMPAVSFIHIDGKSAPIIHLDGIDHLLLDEKNHPQDKGPQSEVEKDAKVRQLLADHGLLESIAAGCIWYDYDKTTQQCTINPFVYVRETQSLFAETACGSGTLAVALYLAGMTQESNLHDQSPSAHQEQNTTFSLDVMQPSGMYITAKCSHNMTPNKSIACIEAWIGGEVTCIAQGVTIVRM